jgi:Mrp family chromosome partitioning ATPase
VVIDSPALGAVSDALSLVSEVSAVVIVGGLGRTTRDSGRELGKQLALLGKKPIGVIANFTEPERGKYSHYYRSELVGPGTPAS